MESSNNIVNQKPFYHLSFDTPKNCIKSVGKVAAGGILLSGVLYGTGCAINTLGTLLVNYADNATKEQSASLSLKSIDYLGSGLSKTGEMTSAVGRKLFLGIATPLYLTFYRFPKWIVQEAIPYCVNIIQQTAEQVCRYAIEATKWFLTNAARIIEWTFNEIILPVAQKILSVIQTVWDTVKDSFDWVINNLIIPVKDLIISIAKRSFDFIKDYVLIPLADTARWVATNAARFIEWTFNEILLPVAQKILSVMQTVWESVKDSFNWVINNLIIPVKDLIISIAKRSFHFIKDHVLIPLADTARWVATNAARFIEWTFNEILLPAAQKIFSMIQTVWETVKDNSDWVINKFIIPVKNLVVAIALKSFSLLKDYALTPLANAAMWTSSHILTPVLKTLAEQVQNIWNLVKDSATWVGNNFVNPIQESVFKIASQIFLGIQQASTSIMTLANKTIERIGDTVDQSITSIQLAANEVLNFFNEVKV